MNHSAETIFGEALRRAAAERADFLDQSCGNDAALRAEIDDLLLAHEHAVGFMQSPAAAAFGAGAIEGDGIGIGAIVGQYKLLEQIGEGGMGVVFMAEQQRPVHRRVALKIVKPGMDTRQVIARFEAERQALAMMDHPNIAKVFDAGATDAGRPYFVMELVRGVPITEYCDRQKLPPRQRLELFVQVCQAVQHAHQKGIIHRDLKPNNVLVTLADDGKPVPKIIDFGIAKATAGQRLTERTLFTEFRQLVGTPLYMSPEQAEMGDLQDVDTRSDVYSLGVLLYELLTGTTPFDKQRLGKAAHEEIRRIIREEEPPRPSTRINTLGDTLTTVSAQRQTDPRKLSTVLRGELDWIVMRALEKDRARRYETANGLAQDVERYLTDQPVEACPPSRAYLLRKMARRNKKVILTASVVAAALAIGASVSIWQAVRAAHERDQALFENRRANEQAAIAIAANDFLNKDLIGQASIINQQTRDGVPTFDLTIREALDRAAASVGARFGRQPLVEASIRFTIGDAYSDLEEYDKAIVQLERALTLRRQILGEAHADTQRTVCFLALNYAHRGEYVRAESMLLDLLESQRRTLGPKHPATLYTISRLGATYYIQEEYGKAGSFLRQGLDGLRKSLGPDDYETLDIETALSKVCVAACQCSEAESLLKDTLERRRRTLGMHPLTVATMKRLGQFYQEQRRFDDAERLLREAHEASVQLFTERSPWGAESQRNLGILYAAAGQFDRAESLVRKAYETMRDLYGNEHPWTLNALGHLGALHRDHGDFTKAATIFRQLLETRRKTLAANPPDATVATALGGIAAVEELRGNGLEAESLVREEVEIRKQLKSDVELQDALSRLQALLIRQRMLPAAADVLRELLALRLRLFPQGSASIADAKSDLGSVLTGLGNYGEAEPLLWQAQAEANALTVTYAVNVCRAELVARLVNLYRNWNKPDKTASYIEKLVDQARQATAKDPAHASLLFLARTYRAQGDFTKAEVTYKQYLAARQMSPGRPPPDIDLWAALSGLADIEHSSHKDYQEEKYYGEALDVARQLNAVAMLQPTLGDYGHALVRVQKYVEAESVQRESVEIGQRLSPEANAYLASQKSVLGLVLTKLGKYAEAESVLLKAEAELQAPPRTGLRDVDMRYRSDTFKRLIDLYQLLNKPVEVRLWATKLEAHLKQVADDAGPSNRAHRDHAWSLAQLGRFDEALVEYRTAIRIDPTAHESWHDGAMPMFLQVGDVEGYRRYRRLELKRFADTTNKTIAHCVAKDCLMIPLSGDELDQAVAMAQRGDIGGAYGAESSGMSEYRRGRFEDAIPLLERSIQGDDPRKAATGQLFLALAHEQLGEHRAAEAMLASAIEIMETRMARTPNADLGHPGDWILCQVVRREAEEEIHGRKPQSASRPTTFPSTSPSRPAELWTPPATR